MVVKGPLLVDNLINHKLEKSGRVTSSRLLDMHKATLRRAILSNDSSLNLARQSPGFAGAIDLLRAEGQNANADDDDQREGE